MFEQVLAEPTQSLLGRLSQSEGIRSFYLAGGTGLALQLGHRMSQDLDWFSQTEFDPLALSAELATTGPVEVTNQKSGTLVVLLEAIEVGFYRYPYPLVSPLESYCGFSVASWKDILCMKLAAIGQRAAKRDYVDLYFGLRDRLTLRELLDLMKTKYGTVNYSEYHLVRSLNYLDEVEAQPMPSTFSNVAWSEVRQFLSGEIRKLSGR